METYKLPLCLSRAVLALSLSPALALAAAPLELQIVPRPPYLMIDANGEASGISVVPAKAAFKKAGIAVTWTQVPALRQLQRLKDNKDKLCSVGWYKTREREQFAKFSSAVSQDTPWAALAAADFHPPKEMTVKSILSSPSTIVLFKKGYVYGDYLDQQFATIAARRMETSGDMAQVFQMIAKGRAHITFAPLEEIQYHLNHHLLNSADVQVIEFREMPDGYKRYLMCSKLVDDALLAQFNAALSHP